MEILRTTEDVDNLLNGERNLTQKVYFQIKTMMLNYEIIPGQRLVFNDLAKRLGVSRTPVNNALAILAREGFLDFTPNQGYKIHQISREEAESLYEIVTILQLNAVGKAIQKITPGKMKTLEEHKARYEKAVTDQVNRGRFLLDQEFHACTIEMSENLYMANYFREIIQRIFLRHRIEGLRPERAEQAVKEHEQIFLSIQIRDVQWARELIRSHIEIGKAFLFSVIFGPEQVKRITARPWKRAFAEDTGDSRSGG